MQQISFIPKKECSTTILSLLQLLLRVICRSCFFLLHPFAIRSASPSPRALGIHTNITSRFQMSKHLNSFSSIISIMCWAFIITLIFKFVVFSFLDFLAVLRKISIFLLKKYLSNNNNNNNNNNNKSKRKRAHFIFERTENYNNYYEVPATWSGSLKHTTLSSYNGMQRWFYLW